MVLVGDERKLEVGSDTALLAVLGCPGEVGVLRVGGNACRKETSGDEELYYEEDEHERDGRWTYRGERC